MAGSSEADSHRQASQGPTGRQIPRQDSTPSSTQKWLSRALSHLDNVANSGKTLLKPFWVTNPLHVRPASHSSTMRTPSIAKTSSFQGLSHLKLSFTVAQPCWVTSQRKGVQYQTAEPPGNTCPHLNLNPVSL